MDGNDCNGILKRCFKCGETVLQNLNIVYNSSNTTVVLWNRFQIFVYENLEFKFAVKIIPEFQIQCLLSYSNYIFCLDSEGNVQVTSLKLKNTAQKRFKTCFQNREQGVRACLRFSEEFILSLKCESNTYFLILNRTNTEFGQFVKKILLICNQDWDVAQTKGKYIFNSRLISEEHSETVQKALKVEGKSHNNWNLLLISFDKTVIYTCLFHPKMSEDHITLVKLYTCPSEIRCIEIMEGADLNIIIGLTIGTLIKLSLQDLTKEPDIVHLNSSIHRLLMHNSSAIYTDGTTTWRAEDVFTKNIKFTKLFVKHVYDILKFGDRIICTTFSNTIYTFEIDDESSYIKLDTNTVYCSAEKFLNNTAYVQKIMEEVERNQKLITQLGKEGNYITALSLSNRPDIMENIVNCKVTVYEDYEEAVTENAEVKLTEDFHKYLDMNTLLFLVTITAIVERRYDDVLSNALGDVKIHITFSTADKHLKTTSIRITEQIRKLSLLIPLNVNKMELTQINVNIKIILSIPGAYDTKQMVWTVVYRKDIQLFSEQFLRTNFHSHRHVVLKETHKPIEELTKQVASHLHGNLFEFNEVPTHQRLNWPLYLKLPNNYKTILNSKEYYQRKLNSRIANYLVQQFSDNFFISGTNITLIVNTEKVNIKIENDDFTSPFLRITCGNMKIALNMRNFFANVIYNDFVNFELGIQFVGSAFYNTVENLQTAVQVCVDDTHNEELGHLIEQFEKHVVGSLPM